jgi:hypothetical protein
VDKWQYSYVVVVLGGANKGEIKELYVNGKLNPAWKQKNISAFLGEMGNTGWELISFISVGYTSSQRELVFKARA